MSAMFTVKGKKALVTGGNQGLGKAFSFALAEEGAEVIIAARNPERNRKVVREAQEAGLAISAIDADITESEEIAAMVSEAAKVLSRIDILVNNAGTCFHNASFDVTDEEWDAVFDLNVKALWRTTRAVGAHMRDYGGGSIVNIGSMSGLIVNRPQWQPAYNASKAAVHHLTKSLAVEWADLNIRVNAVAPGYVKTEMAPVDRPEFQRYWVEDVPQQRFALPEEIAPSVVFLASDAASFITGSVLVADGGYTAV